MYQATVSKFIKTSELYLRLTEQNRSAVNIEEINKLIFLDSSETLQYSNTNVNSEQLHNYSS